MRPDVEAIRALTLGEVVSRMVPLEKAPHRSDGDPRWRFAGSGSSYWLKIGTTNNPDAWKNFKTGETGSPVDLVIAYEYGGPPDYPIVDSYYRSALLDIARAFNLWLTPPQRYAAELATRLASRKGESQSRWMERITTGVDRGAHPEAWGHASELLRALGVDPAQITLCGFRGALCWQPAVPCQGVRISRHEDGYLGGWSTDRAREHAGQAGALELIVIDLDGRKEDIGPGGEVPEEGDKIKVPPLRVLTERLVRDLRHAGLPVAAHVWSSFPFEDRPKSHLYFRMRERAGDEAAWKRWADVIWDAAMEIVEGWRDVSAEEKARFTFDSSAKHIQRLIRLPGFAKHAGEHAGVLYEARGDRVDMVEHLETREVEVRVGRRRLRFGHGLCFEAYQPVDPQADEKITPLCRDFWPLAPYELVDTEGYGVLYRYLTKRGEVCYGRLPASSFADKSTASKAAREALDAGVQIATGQGADWGLALGRWREVTSASPLRLVAEPGWHRGEMGSWVYANGRRVYGCASWRADPSSNAAVLRGARRGDVGDWLARLPLLVTTPGLCLAIAVSLAGPLLARTGNHSFILNFCGASSSGKTSSLRLAACVWGDVRQVLRSWDSTENALEELAAAANDACLPLDELQRYLDGSGGEQVSRAIHKLAGTTGRARLTKTIKMREVKIWQATVLSSSETPIRDLVGDAWRGGDGVRAIDLAVDVGDITHDADHAKELGRFSRQHAGHVGDRWVQHLVRTPQQEIEETFARWSSLMRGDGASAEGGRVLDHLAVMAASMELATGAGLLPEGLHWEPAIYDWARPSILDARAGQDTPEERMLHQLLDSVLGSPGYYPHEQVEPQPRQRWGVLRNKGQAGIELWTTEGMLKRGPLYGHPVRSWLKWCADRGLAARHRNARCCGQQRSWYAFDLDHAHEVAGQVQQLQQVQQQVQHEYG